MTSVIWIRNIIAIIALIGGIINLRSFYKERKESGCQVVDEKKRKKIFTKIKKFTHEKNYQTGKVETKPNIVDSVIYDTIKVSETLMAKTYEYNSEPNDTFQYKLNINSYTEPNWYSLNVRTKNKFTIVNKLLLAPLKLYEI